MKIDEDKDGTPSSMQEVDSNNQVVTRVKKTAQIERNSKTENNNMVATKRRRSKRKKVEKLTESKDNDDPNCKKDKTDNAEPKRPKERNDKELPKFR